MGRPVMRLFWYRRFGYIFRRFLSGMDRNPKYPAWRKNAMKDLTGMYRILLNTKRSNMTKYIKSTSNTNFKLSTMVFGNLENFF
jgi:hypothetical protein